MIMHFLFLAFSFLAIILFLFSVGKLILPFFISGDELSKSPILNVFFCLFLGLISIILIYSYYKSNFHTINILFIPLILYSIYSFKIKKYNFSLLSNLELKALIYFLIISVFVFTLQCSYYFNFNTNSTNTVFIDNYYYSDIVKNLNSFGSENIFYSLNKFLPEFRTELVPYRYADLWFSSFIMDLFFINSLESFYIISSPLIISLLVFFLFYLVSLRISNKYISILISLIVSFSSILFIPKLNSSDELIYLSETTIMGVFKQKTALSALFFLVGLNFFYSNQKLFFVIFLSIPLLYVAYLPAVWGGSGLYLIINYIASVKKKEYINDYLKYIIFLGFMISSYFIFFHFFGDFFQTIESFSIKNVPLIKRIFSGFGSNLIVNLKVFLKENLYKSILYVLGATKNLIFGFLFILPFIFLLFKELFVFKKQVLFVFCLLLVSYGMVILRDGYGDNDQFFANTLVFVNLFLSCIFLKTFFLKKTIKTVFYLFLIVFFCLIPVLKIQYSSHSHVSCQSFISKVSKLCIENKITTVFCVVADSDSNSVYYKSSTKNILIPIANSFNNISFSIANPEIFNNKNQKLDLNYFGNVISNLRIKNMRISNSELFNKYNIQAFLFYPNSKISKYFIKNSKTIIKDESGYTFVFIKNNISVF